MSRDSVLAKTRENSFGLQINLGALMRHNRVGEGPDSATGLPCSPLSIYETRVANRTHVRTKKTNRRPAAVGGSPLRKHDLRPVHAQIDCV